MLSYCQASTITIIPRKKIFFPVLLLSDMNMEKWSYIFILLLFVCFFLFPHCHLYFRILIFLFKALFCSGILSDVHLYLNLQKSCQTWVMSRILSIKRNLSFFFLFFSIDAKSCHCEYTLMVVILDG